MKISAETLALLWSVSDHAAKRLLTYHPNCEYTVGVNRHSNGFDTRRTPIFTDPDDGSFIQWTAQQGDLVYTKNEDDNGAVR